MKSNQKRYVMWTLKKISTSPDFKTFFKNSQENNHLYEQWLFMIHITKHLFLSISMDTSLCNKNKNLCFFIINNIPLLPSDFFFYPPPSSFSRKGVCETIRNSASYEIEIFHMYQHMLISCLYTIKLDVHLWLAHWYMNMSWITPGPSNQSVTYSYNR